MYRSRIIEKKVKRLADYFKVVLIAGARQVGKSSLSAHLFPDHKTFVFDPIQDLYNAHSEPDLFLKNFAPPLILDEIQCAPELLPSLKRKVDQSEAKGQYLLTGSQQLSVLKTISESLAGRVVIIELGPMTPQEMYGDAQKNNSSWLERYITSPHTLRESFNGTIPTPELFETLWRGGMPGTLAMPLNNFPPYFYSYIQTYVERDVRTLENIQDLGLFGRFFALLGALTAQEINYSQLGRDIAISPATAQRWLKLLRYSYQWHGIPAYHGNAVKKVSSKPKGFFTDVGMACYLQHISSPAALAGSPLLGALFETFCFTILRGLTAGLDMAPQF